MSKSDYEAVRAVLKSFSSAERYFAYCADDDTLIWHQGFRGPWVRDDDGSTFITFAAEKVPMRLAQLTLAYFKAQCLTSHISAALKEKRLAGDQAKRNQR